MLYIQCPAILFLFSKKKRRKYSDNKFISRELSLINKWLERKKEAKVENNPVEKIKGILIRKFISRDPLIIRERIKI